MSRCGFCVFILWGFIELLKCWVFHQTWGILGQFFFKYLPHSLFSFRDSSYTYVDDLILSPMLVPTNVLFSLSQYFFSLSLFLLVHFNWPAVQFTEIFWCLIHSVVKSSHVYIFISDIIILRNRISILFYSLYFSAEILYIFTYSFHLYKSLDMFIVFIFKSLPGLFQSSGSSVSPFLLIFSLGP